MLKVNKKFSKILILKLTFGENGGIFKKNKKFFSKIVKAIKIEKRLP